MLCFCGQDRCQIDSNGRIRLCPRFVRDFHAVGEQIVLHCLPENALGVYPLSVWAQMRQAEPRPAAKAAESVVFRRQLRRFGAVTQGATLSNQGRITIPPHFRCPLDLEPGREAVVVGCEIGVEVWHAERWEKEFELLRSHELRKADADMRADLIRRGAEPGHDLPGVDRGRDTRRGDPS